MGLEDFLGLTEILNNTDFSVLEVLPPETLSQIGSLITLLKITGFIIIGYIIFLFIRWIFSIRRHRKITKIYEKVNEIDRKLDVLMSKKKKEERLEVKEEEIVKKKGDKKKEGLIKRLFGKGTKKKKKKRKKK